MKSIYPDYGEQLTIFETIKLRRESDPISSKIAAVKVKSFKKGHEDKIRDLLKQYNGSTAKELETLSQGTENEISFVQIGKRTGAMLDVKTGNYKADKCCELWLVEL